MLPPHQGSNCNLLAAAAAQVHNEKGRTGLEAQSGTVCKLEQPPFNASEQYRKITREWFRERTPDQPHIPEDWADDLIKRTAIWVSKSEVPEVILRQIANVPNVLLQVPAPDHRWILKFRGVLYDPFDFRSGGWRDVHDLITHRACRVLNTSDIQNTGLAGELTVSGSGRSCADGYAEAIRKKIERWLKLVSRQMTL